MVIGPINTNTRDNAATAPATNHTGGNHQPTAITIPANAKRPPLPTANLAVCLRRWLRPLRSSRRRSSFISVAPG
jgi:hypothetical protein